MNRSSNNHVRWLLALASESAIVFFAFVSAYFIKKYVMIEPLRGLTIDPNYWGVLAVLLISSWLVVLFIDIGGGSIVGSAFRPKKIISQVFFSTLLAVLLLYLTKEEGISRLLIVIYCINYVLIKVVQSIVLTKYPNLFGYEDLLERRYVLVGDKYHLNKIKNVLEASLGDLVRVNCIETWLTRKSSEDRRDKIQEQSRLLKSLKENVMEGVVDGLILPLSLAELKIGKSIVNLCKRVGISVYFVSGSNIAAGYSAFAETHHDCFFLGLEPLAHSPSQLVKRLSDIALASFALTLFSPIMILAAAAIKIISPHGPVFFHQERCGLNRRVFNCFKFRTMVPNAEDKLHELLEKNEMDGPVFKLKDDPRIIPFIGKIMRKTGIDELPQLFNVLHGEMTIVGPRPPIPSEVHKYPLRYHKRLSVKPGITCLWQCTPSRNDMKFDEWMALDHYYIDNWSNLLDMRIILKTVKVVLTAQGR